KKLVTNSYKLSFISYKLFWRISLNLGGQPPLVSPSMRNYPLLEKYKVTNSKKLVTNGYKLKKQGYNHF
ncbi:Uncharacterized protein FWK35_00025716, partial [Aphis craccivora]